jgi:hypothetical protein
MPVLNYVTLMLAFGKFVHRKDNVYPNPVTEEDINMNADKKLYVDPCNDRWITNFVDKGEKDQIRPSQAESIEKVDVVSVTFVPGVGGGGKTLSRMSVLQKTVWIAPKPTRPVWKPVKPVVPEDLGVKLNQRCWSLKTMSFMFGRSMKPKGHDQRKVEKPKPQKF